MDAIMINAILSIAMLSALLLLYGATKRWRRDGTSQQMWLMVAAALVIIANVAIWVVPDEKGQSLVTGAVEQR
jgi:peptidoglycan biosynthesis protein MviN/MurJ (putative lipid II flippase)